MRRRTFFHLIPIALAALLYVMITVRPSPAPMWYWAPMTLCPVGMALCCGYAAWLGFHEQRRRESGLCRDCGYDLRATPGTRSGTQ